MGAARDVAGGVRQDLEIHVSDDGPYVPCILTVPRERPAPAVLLLHGFGSRKERMADSVGAALVRQGVASFALDLPMHGAREGDGIDLRSMNPLKLASLWRDAVREADLGLAFLASRDDVDGARLGIVGYSLGSFLANVAASASRSVGAVVLAAGGDLPDGIPFEPLVRGVVDPLRAVRAIAGRPLLMINGRYDRTVTPAQAERLFAAAMEPKTMRWYNGGHWPPEREIEFAASWLAGILRASASPAEPQRSQRRREPPKPRIRQS